MGSQEPATDRIAITGMGLVTSLGLDAPSSLAAIRSDIANFTEHETVLVNCDRYGTELDRAKIARLPEQVIGRQVHGTDRAAALLAPAVRECLNGLPRTLLEKAGWHPDSGMLPLQDNIVNLRTSLIALPLSAIRKIDTSDSALGRCQFFEHIAQASAELLHGTTAIAMVACVDSLCDNPVLEKLADHDRLKSGTNPEGIVAGEAAGAFLLELESHAVRRHANILAYLTAWGRAIEPHPWTGNGPSIAIGLRSAFGEAFSLLPDKGEEIDLVIADLNGERARGNEWGITRSIIFRNNEKVRELKHPADCTGDCGAALGAILLATAIDLASGTSGPANIALATSDDAGARRILCLQSGNGRDLEAKGDREAQGDGHLRSEAPSAVNEQTTFPCVIPAVIEQHIDEVSFLWTIRRRLARSSNRGFHDLKRHDDRLQANLEGLVRAGEAGCDLSQRTLSQGDAGEYFAAAYLAIHSFDMEHISDLLEKAGTRIDLYKGIISALGWLSPDDAKPYLERFLTAASPLHRYIAIAASGMHRHDPGQSLTAAAYDPSPLVKARALRAYGELGRNSRADVACLQRSCTAEDDGERFWASWSATLAGDHEAVANLKGFAAPGSPYMEAALDLALRRMDRETALSWHEELLRRPDSLRLAVVGAGIIGDPALVPWLLDQLRTADLACVAGDAFRSITGIDLAVAGLEGAQPEGFGAAHNDDPEDGCVAMDPDQIPWPDYELTKAWWDRNRGNFQRGSRHLLGKPIREEHLRQVLSAGNQSARAAAALELAMIHPGRPLIDVRAPASRQRNFI